ncbi:MAG TPA: hypothetical protein VF719_07890 [Abditibacteriaceae bacterium]
MDTEYCISAIAQLQKTGIVFEDGLSAAEIEAVESKFNFVFPPDLKMFLQTALPVSIPTDQWDCFPNWRSGDESQLWDRLNWPYEGMCFDIKNNVFWMDDWGVRPSSDEEACAIAREKVIQAPTLIPIFSHRYMAATPCLEGNPVYSVVQTDIIYYGLDLPSYLANEFGISNPYAEPKKPKRIDFWSYLPDMWIPEWNSA